MFLFNVNVDTTPIIYDYYENNNYLTFGPSEVIETIDPTFTV